MTTTLAPAVSRHSTASAREVMEHYRKHGRCLTAVVQTSYVPATDTEGACYRAVDLHTGDIHFVAPDYSLTTGENHLHAAINLLAEFRVADYRLLSICTDGFEGRGYVITFASVEA